MLHDGDDNFKHIPVMPEEVLEYLVPETGRLHVIDATLGCGGHSSLILGKNRQAVLLGIDRDGDALSRAEKVLKFASGRFHLKRGKFSDLADLAAEVGWASADTVLLDLGVSSPQIDEPRRGFSFRQDGPLDMRMDARDPRTASRILNTAPAEELERIFRDYGEIRRSRKLAETVIAFREEKMFSRTSELAKICEKILGPSRPGKLPAPTLCFQALRIAVNDELGELEKALEKAVQMLAKGGRIGVISFHSLEDRIVKNFFRHGSSNCICPPDFPECRCKHRAFLKIITKRPLTASKEETEENPRAKSAKFRVAEKII